MKLTFTWRPTSPHLPDPHHLIFAVKIKQRGTYKHFSPLPLPLSLFPTSVLMGQVQSRSRPLSSPTDMDTYGQKLPNTPARTPEMTGVCPVKKKAYEFLPKYIPTNMLTCI
ncbi:hypothetical protein E2C01_074088 [Portunus trituberculatus]|uniref:Uncharacterized protein n=1 Tax=Portunus trituberculatus TaxID=210409 RepID=A0A5B7IDE6_PORTR|nr:hypothetical protein [Portunus trituberculatus]